MIDHLQRDEVDALLRQHFDLAGVALAQAAVLIDPRGRPSGRDLRGADLVADTLPAMTIGRSAASDASRAALTALRLAGAKCSPAPPASSGRVPDMNVLVMSTSAPDAT